MSVRRLILTLTLVNLIAANPAGALVSNVLLEDFEGGVADTAGGVRVTAANSSASGDSFSSVPDNVAEGGSRRLRFQDPGGNVNGITFTIPNAFSAGGNYLITADVKVDNSSPGGQSSPIETIGIAGRIGGTSTAKISDTNAGYVMNLDQYPTTGATLGYQKIGLAVQVPAAGPFPQSLTLYVSSDPSGNTFNGTNDGNFSSRHRGGSTNTWANNPAGNNTNAVYIDNIRKTGPGNFGEERHAWISIGDSMTNLSTLESLLVAAKNNNFNCVDILVRYRANRYYRKNRDFSTYTHNEPFASGASNSNDPIQYAIDRGHELGLKIFGTVSCFLVTDGSNTYPSAMPAGSQTHWYNNAGTPVAQTTTHDSEGIWADVGRADVRTHTITVVRDLVQNYDLDGVIFDRIRYANPQFGYNPTALTEMGYSPGTYPATGDATFEGKRQDAVTTFLHDSYEAITNLKPWVIVGTVPIAYGSDLDSTYQQVYQSWPKWSSIKTNNRAFSFGAQDLIQPQFYRQWDTSSPHAAPAANQALMRNAIYGDTSAGADPKDFGLMPGANVMLAPLFYTETLDDATDRINTGNAIAQNICDTQTFASYPLNGSGIWRMGMAVSTSTGDSLLNSIRAATPTCGGDVLASIPTQPDYLMKAGYDNTPPNAVTGLNVTGGFEQANLTWSTPAAAADGETPSRYLVYRSTSSPVKQFYSNQAGVTTTITGNSFTDTAAPAGSVYYLVVPVDDYNNKGTASQFGPVSITTGDVVVESETAGGSVASGFTSSLGMTHTTSKSAPVPGPSLSGQGSRFGTTLNQTATFTPNLPVAGTYNVYVTLDDSSSGPSNNANTNYTIINSAVNQTGSVHLIGTDGTLANQWKLLKSNVPFNAGTAGKITFTNVDADDSGPQPGVRFCMDAVWFEYVAPLSGVNKWSMY